MLGQRKRKERIVRDERGKSFVFFRLISFCFLREIEKKEWVWEKERETAFDNPILGAWDGVSWSVACEITGLADISSAAQSGDIGRATLFCFPLNQHCYRRKMYRRGPVCIFFPLSDFVSRLGRGRKNALWQRKGEKLHSFALRRRRFLQKEPMHACVCV